MSCPGCAHSSWPRRTVLLPIAIALSILAGACSTRAPRHSPLMKEARATAISQHELRERLMDYIIRYSAAVEFAADSMMRLDADDYEAYELAMRMKMQAIPAGQLAAFRTDPFTGALDTWALILQVRHRIDTIQQQSGFDMSLFAQLFEELDEEIEDLVELTYDEDTRVTREGVETWARENPINAETFGRPSTIPLLSSLAETQQLGAMASVGSMSEAIEGLSGRLGIYLAAMPKQARWQAELVLARTLNAIRIDSLLATFEALRDVSETANQQLAGLTETIQGERAIIMDAVTDERIAALFAVDRMRLETLVAIRGEREAAFEDLDGVLSDAFVDIERMRLETLLEVEELRARAIEEAAGLLESAIDHVFLRLIQLAIVAAALVLVALLLFRRRRPRPATA